MTARTDQPAPEPQGAQGAHGARGDEDAEGDAGDRSLIRWMLSLTPAERLEVLEEHVTSVLELRELNRGLWASARSSSD